MRTPEYLLVAEDGYALKGFGSTLRPPFMVPAKSPFVPVWTESGNAPSITDIKALVEEQLARTKKVVLVVVEGVGMNDFPSPPDHAKMERTGIIMNRATLSTLLSPPVNIVFSIIRSATSITKKTRERGHFPFRAILPPCRRGPWDNTFSGRSIAVGNKSMFMHTVTGADLCIECFSRNLYNQGVMGVIHRHDKAGRKLPKGFTLIQGGKSEKTRRDATLSLPDNDSVLKTRTEAVASSRIYARPHLCRCLGPTKRFILLDRKELSVVSFTNSETTPEPQTSKTSRGG